VIVFHACGGLGNQMFQYAMARQVAIDSGMELRVDLSWYKRQRAGVTPRKFELLSYEISLARAPLLFESLSVVLRHRRSQFLWPLLGLRPIDEVRHEVHSNLCFANGAYLRGYWQDERYFCRIRSLLQVEFQPRPSLADADWLAEITSSESVCLHVRRGDYVTLPSASQYHGCCSLDYYRSAMELVAMRVRSPKFFVFSDDPVWAERNLPRSFGLRHVSMGVSRTATEELQLMSRCRHHIIANSSFSWWSAWLGETPGGVVVAPDPWFSGRGIDSTPVPTRWNKLPR
jgi:hypothetical protein